MDYTFQIPNLESKPETLNQVGTLATQRMDYTFGSEFEKDLKAAVAKIVKPNQRFATPGYIFRAACYISTYAGLTYWYVTKGSSVPLCIAIGMSQASIGLNVQHDANHGAVSPNPFWNELLGFGADLIGGCKYLWLQQHWTHHAFTNDIERDPDASSTGVCPAPWFRV